MNPEMIQLREEIIASTLALHKKLTEEILDLKCHISKMVLDNKDYQQAKAEGMEEAAEIADNLGRSWVAGEIRERIKR